MPRPNRPLPPDPDGQNADRAHWAFLALAEFIHATGIDPEDAVADLLCDLRHWCDRNNMSFRREYDRALRHYKQETRVLEDVPPTQPPPPTQVPFRDIPNQPLPEQEPPF